MGKPHHFYIAFKEGVVWNITQDLEQVEDWLDSGIIECYAQYLPQTELIFKKR